MLDLSDLHKEYMLAGHLLLKEGEKCWDLDGYFQLDNQWRPVYVARVTVAIPNDGSFRYPQFSDPMLYKYMDEYMPGETRKGTFIFDGQEWKPVENYHDR